MAKGFLNLQKVKVGDDLGIIQGGVYEGKNGDQVYKVKVFTEKFPKGQMRILSVDEIEMVCL